MNDVEREAIILNTAWEMIDGMVNWAVFMKIKDDKPYNLMFKSSTEARLFNILLGDFLSDVRAFKGKEIPLGLKPVPSGTSPSNLTFLFHIRQVCKNPQLGNDASQLLAAVEAMADWLEGEFIAEDVNLSTIGVVADLKISRFRYLKMCGDMAKHNLAKLETNVKHLRNLLAQAGCEVSEQGAYLAVGTFYEWFHSDIFMYHASHIAELLNDIRWAIYDYLQSEFLRSRCYVDEPEMPGILLPRFNVPKAIGEPLAAAMYWNIMNQSRRKPYVPRFKIAEQMKDLY